MNFTDAHCHLTKEFYDNLDEVLDKCKKVGVTRYIANSTDYDSSLEVLELVKKYDNVYGAIGLHPEDVDKDFDYKILEKAINNDKIVAIGEIGLDYHYDGYNKDKEIEAFREQLKFAEAHNIPVIVHSRDATQDTLDILKEYKVTGLIHSFSGSLEVAKEYVKRGFLLGINGVITFKNCKIKDVYKNIPLENIVLETDSPFLTPVPYRGEKNDPSHIIDIAKFVSELYGISMEELEKVTNENIDRVFMKK